MKSHFATFLICAAAALTAGSANAGTAKPGQSNRIDLATIAQPQVDPLAPVFVVTSRDTYQKGVQLLARNGVGRRDSVGNDLVIAELRNHQLADINEIVHQRELRCGGYFAFTTRAEAEAFIRSDRSLQAINAAALVAYTIDNQATVNPWLPQVQETNIRSTIGTLSGYQNRYYSSGTGKTSAEWIRDTWQALAAGRSDVTTELYTACTDCSTQPSVILTIQGTELPNEIVVLGAHLDSINVSANGSATQVAPGADDDASGIATLTEVIRIALASGWKPQRTIKFMGYAAEEVGLRGSKSIAQSFKAANKNVVGVLQLDMTNYKSGSGVDMQLITDYSNAEMKTFLTNLFDAYLAPLGLTRGTYTCGYGCSDHASWTSAGYPSAMMFEAGDASGYFPYIHSANDTLANMGQSAQYSVKFAKLGLAFLGELGKTTGTTPPPTALILSNGVPATGLGAATGSSVTYIMNVPAGATGLKFVTAGGTGDLDMYVKFGSAPTDTVYDCRPYASGNAETCTIATAQTGTYYIRLKAYATFSGASLTGSFTPGGGGQTQTYSNGTDVAIGDNTTVNSPITVSGRSGNAPSNASVTVAIVHTYQGDLKVDLVAPDGTLYNIHNRTGGGTDNINKTVTLNLSSEALNGTWKLQVNDNASGDTGKIDSWSITF
ncbi:M20/M25/M40 family metallo-hydrolase [Arenimonas oryziterrae]|uniref:P/Homo B domain-containing protein n=1 Tax=Arenimonas oryziterrae DSM 21050 = YC6267 TaxID=1121015 RepID=A0A091BG37_9GAMM|nr:M20/M25/M40 family metallo-hydrolase [Arenimonas oryziterrae]KFN43335.1 hypothetical protein N789_08660 [Arenimonas oryziterrae DSM 21050 = YC6267]